MPAPCTTPRILAHRRKMLTDVNNFRHHEIPPSLTHRSYSHRVGTAHSHRRNPHFSDLLTAENDFDAEELALLDDFSDAIAACIADRFDGSI